MNVYQIFITHNRAWSKREIIVFALIMLGAVIVLGVLTADNKIRKIQAAAVLGLLVFLGIVLGSTVFTREPGNREYELMPFWSWKKIFFYGNMGLLQENLLNCILLMPMGCLLPVIMGHQVKLKNAFAAGLMCSALIEVSQLVFKRGLFEWDDMIHNSLGCLLGCFLVNIIVKKKYSD